MTDNNDDYKLTDNDWDRIDAELQNASARLHWIQGAAHDNASDAIIAIEKAREEVRTAKYVYEKNLE